MFEPLRDLFDKHGTTFAEILKDVRTHLAQIVQNTTSRMVFEHFGSYTGTGKGELQIANTEGTYWKVIVTGVKAKKPVVVHVGTPGPESIVDVIEPVESVEAGASNHAFYVPPRSTIFYKGSEEEITVNVQVERLIESPQFVNPPTVSHDVSDIDKHLVEPERHEVQRTRKPTPDELRRPSLHR